MPNIPNKFKNLQKSNDLLNDNLSFNNHPKPTSNFSPHQRIKQTDYLPRLNLDRELLMLLREEAKSRKWSLTTLMNEILEERYKSK